ncbi:serine/threonine-protein kinase B-raf-like isoform X1 [Mytilus californianus]|uniref:serine/threonine-protein kinase B-raf-like isoform X1 n=1 Tax=Mytilus californianus TaxID=6549 RepID=UPI002247B72E|nr:serine/threonine-protein kinase B-raf-like isoform X1 [Mytilus californianus]
MAVVQPVTMPNGDIQDLPNTPPRHDAYDIANLLDQIRNIQNLLRLTKENLEALNAKFGSKQQPDPMYLQEYEALANKIHELQEKESQLLTDYEQHSCEPSPPEETEPPPQAPGPTLPIVPQPSPTPSRPILRVNFPNDQVSSVRIEAGKTLKDALKKAMSRREIEAESCEVYDVRTRMPISWDIDIGSLANKELKVQSKSHRPSVSGTTLPMFTHNIVRKTFLLLTFCDGCGRSLFQSLRCQTCGIRFHQRCIDKVNPVCSWDSMKEWARHNKLPVDTFTSSFPFNSRNQSIPVSPHTPQRSKPALGQRDRSSSAPNVCLINPGEISHEDSKVLQEATMKDGGHAGVHTLPIPSSNHGHSPGSSPTGSSQHSPTAGEKRQRASSEEADPGKIRSRQRRDSNEDWEIAGDQIQVYSKIGSGSFGTVYRGHYHGFVAIKRLNVTDPTPQQLKAFKNEVAVLRKTRHTNVLLFMGWTSKPWLAIITQWCEGSSLYKHLHVQEHKFEMITLMEISRQTAQGMDYLHAKSIIHRDLKSNNIFLTDILTVKIGDFGLATVKTRWSGSHQFQQPTGSILWMAPEVIRMQEDNPYTNQSDVYSFGIVLYELMTGQLPYGNISNKDQILFMVGKGYLRPDYSKIRSDSPKRLKILFQDCCKFEREQRPLFPQILSVLETLERSLPKVHRSSSEPTLNQSHTEDYDLMYMCASPKTPINSQYSQFIFSSPTPAY